MGYFNDQRCFMTASDPYEAHRHSLLIAEVILQSEYHTHEEAGQHDHPLNEMVSPDLDAALSEALRCLQRARSTGPVAEGGGRVIGQLPIGYVLPYRPDLPVPDGWLACDGGSTENFPALADVIGPNVPNIPVGVLGRPIIKAVLGESLFCG